MDDVAARPRARGGRIVTCGATSGPNPKEEIRLDLLEAALDPRLDDGERPGVPGAPGRRGGREAQPRVDRVFPLSQARRLRLHGGRAAARQDRLRAGRRGSDWPDGDYRRLRSPGSAASAAPACGSPVGSTAGLIPPSLRLPRREASSAALAEIPRAANKSAAWRDDSRWGQAHSSESRERRIRDHLRSSRVAGALRRRPTHDRSRLSRDRVFRISRPAFRGTSARAAPAPGPRRPDERGAAGAAPAHRHSGRERARPGAQPARDARRPGRPGGHRPPRSSAGERGIGPTRAAAIAAAIEIARRLPAETLSGRDLLNEPRLVKDYLRAGAGRRHAGAHGSALPERPEPAPEERSRDLPRHARPRGRRAARDPAARASRQGGGRDPVPQPSLGRSDALARGPRVHAAARGGRRSRSACACSTTSSSGGRAACRFARRGFCEWYLSRFP